MPILKELALAVTALVMFLFISNAFLGPAESEGIKDSTTSGRPWIGTDPVPAERWLAKDSITTGGSWMGAQPAPAKRRFSTPAARIREVFAQFVPGERRRAI